MLTSRAHSLTLAAALALTALTPSLGQARRRPEGPPAYVVRRAFELGDGRIGRLRTAQTMQPARSGAWLELPDDVLVPLHEGSPVSASVASGHGAHLVALAVDHGGASGRFELRHVITRAGTGVVGPARVVPRANPPAGSPFGVAVAVTPRGFAVFFQELDASDPTLARTYLAQVDPEGTPSGPAVEIPVPWGIAAAAWNGQGYHLALIYPGAGVRLSMVTLDPSGRPQQHPDWASPAGIVADVHLLAEGGRVLAYYRGGARGEALLEADVTAIRGWGSEPPSARRVGRLDADQLIVVTGAGTGERARAVR